MRDASVLGRALACALLLLAWPETAGAAPQFQGYDIRVIRPRYFSKDDRLEAGIGLSAIMNQSFVYSFLGTGILTWHFSETLAVEGQGSYGQSFDRDEKRVLKDDFGIRTVVLRTESMANARVVWTPSYGKYLLNETSMVYFDTFLTAGVGKTGVRIRFDHCDDEGAAARGEQTKQYDTGILGLGQRHFLSATSDLRIGAEVQRFLVDTGDASCQADAPSVRKSSDNVVLFLGWSLFL